MTNQHKKRCAYATIAAALTLSPLAALSQVAPANSPNDAATTRQTTTTDDRGYRTEHHNYGWIGLLGLLGLAGLVRRRDDRVTYTDRTDSRQTTPGTRNQG